MLALRNTRKEELAAIAREAWENRRRDFYQEAYTSPMAGTYSFTLTITEGQ